MYNNKHMGLIYVYNTTFWSSLYTEHRECNSKLFIFAQNTPGMITINWSLTKHLPSATFSAEHGNQRVGY